MRYKWVRYDKKRKTKPLLQLFNLVLSHAFQNGFSYVSGYHSFEESALDPYTP